MKVYRDLKLSLEKFTKEKIIEKIDAQLPTTCWARDTCRENELTEKLDDVKQYAYSTVDNDDLPDARLWLADNDEDELYVSNIVPCKAGKLTMDEYNSILVSFVDVLKNDSTISHELTEADRSLEDIIPEDVAEKLKRFSKCANKSTGYSHPNDLGRWLDFVISLHQCKCEPKLDLIERWLHEEAGWLWETASELSGQLEYSLEVLKHYDEANG